MVISFIDGGKQSTYRHNKNSVLKLSGMQAHYSITDSAKFTPN
jgi:hypothetical protein